jgi:iron complex transport system substrate-binding protein
MNTKIRWIGYGAVLLAACLSLACGQSTGDGNREKSFIQIGEFSVHRISPTRTEVRDGAGRTLLLVPRDAPAPEDTPAHWVVRTPVKRVAAYGYFDVSTMLALGVLEEVLVGVTTPEDEWHIQAVKDGMEEGRIAFLGDSTAIDIERLRRQEPELVLTWDHAIIPMLDELGIPCAVTSTPTAMCLNARMRFVKFLAPFFNKEEAADAFFERVNNALIEIREKTKNAGPMPKVMWGDIYEKRVLVEPGNAWVGELIGLAESDYLFEDVFGTSCIEISIERFLYSGEDADIFVTYRSPDSGATSKAAIARMNPILSDIKPINEGKVYAPQSHYSQSGHRLDEILTEIAAILHPEVYPDHDLKFFRELPETDPQTSKGVS